MKKLFAIVLAVAMLLTFAACGAKPVAPAETTAAAAEAPQTDLEYVTANGKMIVGITDYAPMDFKDDSGNWTGFDAEFAMAVCEKLGIACEFIEIDWDNKFLELDAKTIDCIWNGMTITDEAKLNASVSNPYVKNAQVVVMPADVAANYATEESLKDVSFSVEAGSAGEAALTDRELTNVIALQTQSAALMEVAAGTADACVIDVTMANAMTGEGTSYPNLVIVQEFDAEEYGVAFRTGSDLCGKFNDLMAAMMADGSLDNLAAKYELTLVK